MTPASSLPPIDQAAFPADVRRGGSAAKKDWTAALSFERVLVAQLAKTMVATAKPVAGDDAEDGGIGGGDGGDSTDAATSSYLDMLPDQLADSLTRGGGLGLARGFYDALRERA